MPAYEFKDVQTGEIVFLEMSFRQLMAKLDVMRRIKYKGRVYQRIIRATEKPAEQRVGNLAYNRDLVSRGAGVHSSQAAEFNQAARRAGISGVYYDPKTGNAHFSSRKARRLELARRGINDRDGGYGDG